MDLCAKGILHTHGLRLKLKQWTAQQLAEKVKEASVPPSEISITRLIDDCLLILYREVKALNVLSEEGKLGVNQARNLRDHLKLLFDLKDREKDSLQGITDEDLKKALDENL